MNEIDREILLSAAQESASGFVNPLKLGMVFATPSQLKRVSQMLSEQAKTMTKEQIDRVVFEAQK